MSLLIIFLALQTPTQITNSVATTSVRAGSDPHQIVCIRQVRTGSRVDVQRICRTRKEWAELQADQRNFVDRIQQPAGSCIMSICGNDEVN